MTEFSSFMPTAAIMPTNVWQRFRLVAMRTIYFGVGAILLMLAVLAAMDKAWWQALVLLLVGGAFVVTWWRYQQHLAPQWINFVFVCALGALVSFSMKSAGMMAVYWMYPVLAMVFFMFDKTIFILVIMLVYALFAAAMYQFLPFDYAWRIGLSMLVLIAVGATFLVMMLNMQRNLIKATTSDPLTGFYKREYLDELLQHHLQQAEQRQRSLCLMLIDLDAFKAVNDKFGYMFGDAVLQDTARRIRACCRPDDIFIRGNGAEFIVIFPNASLREAAQYSGCVLDNLRHEPFAIKSMMARVTASAGVTQWRPGESWEQLLEKADDAMDTAKSQGRDRLRIAQ